MFKLALLVLIISVSLCGCKKKSDTQEHIDNMPNESVGTSIVLSEKEVKPLSDYGYAEYKVEAKEVPSITGDSNLDTVIQQIMEENGWSSAVLGTTSKDPYREVYYYDVIFDEEALYTFSVEADGTVYSNQGDYFQYLWDNGMIE